MFKRLLLDDSAAWFTLVAFFTAASVFAAIVWRAVRMTPAQTARFENLPLTPDANSVRENHRHDTRS